MTDGGGAADVASLIDDARDVYADDTAALELLERYDRRLHEPLRLAVAGMVKAGKSTMLNALIGEQIAPTDAGECTRIITWYRHGRTASLTAHLVGGAEVRLPVKRTKGRLVLDLGSLTAEEVAWIDVQWPSESLRSVVLIDTPGIASLSHDVSERSARFLTPTQSPSEADAILYLLRHIHGSDVHFLEAFRDTAAGASQTVNAVAILSRADEVGSGRIDSLLSAARIADRYRRDGELRALALECIPVAGLLAEGARTLREGEFAAFKELASLDRKVRDGLLTSVDRFVRSTKATTLTPAQRRSLLARFGIFGVRLAAALVRGGATTSTELSSRLVAQSGLVDVQQFVADQFRARSAALKSRSILTGIERLVRDRPRAGSARLLAGLERITSQNHDLRELALLADLRTSIPSLDAADAASAERIIGGSGAATHVRLSLPDDADAADVDARVLELLAHWRGISESPLSTRTTVQLCRTVVRSVEGIASELAGGGGSDRGRDSAADVVAAGGPLQRRP